MKSGKLYFSIITNSQVKLRQRVKTQMKRKVKLILQQKMETIFLMTMLNKVIISLIIKILQLSMGLLLINGDNINPNLTPKH